jgi:hypothetical protein
LLITCPLGIRFKTALTAIGSNAVTAIPTGRNTHHRAIQAAIPRALAAALPKDCAVNRNSKNASGPDSNAKFRFISELIAIASKALRKDRFIRLLIRLILPKSSQKQKPLAFQPTFLSSYRICFSIL